MTVTEIMHFIIINVTFSKNYAKHILSNVFKKNSELSLNNCMQQ